MPVRILFFQPPAEGGGTERTRLSCVLPWKVLDADTRSGNTQSMLRSVPDT